MSAHAFRAAAGLAREDGVLPVADDQRLLLGNLLDQVALALERARLEGEARDVAALRERDRLRSALLTSIGEDVKPRLNARSEEHTSELQSLMRISYAVFCLKKKTKNHKRRATHTPASISKTN